MTDRSDHDDEIVSATIDGEATTDEAARVAADPVLQARRATLESAAQVLGAPVEPTPAPAREEAIAAALAAFDAPGLDDRRTESETAPVVGVRSRRPSPWVAVAAIALAVVAAGALLLRVRDTSTTSTAARRSVTSSSVQQYSAGSASGGAAATSGQTGKTQGNVAGDSATVGAEAAAAAPAVAALGSFATVDDLTAAVRARLAPGATPAPSSTAPFTCPPPAELASVQLVASATLGGRALLIFAGPTAAQGAPAYIAVDSACTKVLEQDL